MSELLRQIFQPELRAERERAKFLSRLFGIFAEQVVSVWAMHDRAPYENLGRPTVRERGNNRGYTLDFALRGRSTGKLYVCEMKCEIEYQNFRYFILESAKQLDHHSKPAFDQFRKTARPSEEQTVYLKGQPVTTDGAILIWGAVTPKGREETMNAGGFHDVLSVDQICSDLASWNCSRYLTLIEQRRTWCNHLFDSLLPSSVASVG